MHAAASNPPTSDPSTSTELARDVLPTLAGVGWRDLRKTVRRAQRRPSDRHLHKVRIRAKQVRYAAELLAPVIGKQAVSTAKAAKHLQTLLGHHQDAVQAQQWLRRQAEAGPGMVGFAAGQLAAGQRHRALATRAAWASCWHRLYVGSDIVGWPQDREPGDRPPVLTLFDPAPARPSERARALVRCW